jgi:hypothetical protein
VALSTGTKSALLYRLSTDVVLLSTGSALTPLQSTHVATAPPQFTAFKLQTLLALPQVQPRGQRMHVSIDKLLPPVQVYPLSI